MLTVGKKMVAVLMIGCAAITAVPPVDAETPSEAQLERLMQMASQTPDRPDPASHAAAKSGPEAVAGADRQNQNDY